MLILLLFISRTKYSLNQEACDFVINTCQNSFNIGLTNISYYIKRED